MFFKKFPQQGVVHHPVLGEVRPPDHPRPLGGGLRHRGVRLEAAGGARHLLGGRLPVPHEGSEELGEGEAIFLNGSFFSPDKNHSFKKRNNLNKSIFHSKLDLYFLTMNRLLQTRNPRAFEYT